MKASSYIMFIAAALLGSACERTLDFEGPKEETTNDLIINALAVEGGDLKVFLNRAYLVNKTPTQYVDYDHAVFMQDDITTDYVSNYYAHRSSIINADVTAVVNGQNTYDLQIGSQAYYYTSADYVPQAGDHIVVTASMSTKKVSTETVVPDKPQIEIISHEVIPENPYQEMNGLTNLTDTIVRLTCRIKNTGGEHYYRLRVRNEGYYYEETNSDYWNGEKWERLVYSTYLLQDIYFSDDELFFDNRITKNFGGWPAYFSNVFDNSLMKGSDYTFTIDSPKAFMTYRYLTDVARGKLPFIPDRVMVELQAISPEFYRYLKSVQLYRITEADAYSEPLPIYSNVEGGWGILGALSYDRHYVVFGE